ncbi:MAG TPA: sigma-70 family RNA polymerase sigma factor [Acidimicrobiales bacterium]|nr:sigma-70 family RNA polymerase sigma factor [Acidimicrobiales bacterium]
MPDDVTRQALAARDGDRVAFAGFVRQTQGDVWRLCAHLVDPGSADDLTQETYLRAVTAIGRFRGDSTAKTWLLTIARRVCADSIRRRTRRRRALLRRGPEAEAVAEPAGAIELQAVMAGLTPDRRTAFTLTQVLGLSYEEAAAVVGCPVGTIRSRVARARADLVAALADEASTPGP